MKKRSLLVVLMMISSSLAMAQSQTKTVTCVTSNMSERGGDADIQNQPIVISLSSNEGRTTQSGQKQVLLSMNTGMTIKRIFNIEVFVGEVSGIELTTSIGKTKVKFSGEQTANFEIRSATYDVVGSCTIN